MRWREGVIEKAGILCRSSGAVRGGHYGLQIEVSTSGNSRRQTGRRHASCGPRVLAIGGGVKVL